MNFLVLFKKLALSLIVIETCGAYNRTYLTWSNLGLTENKIRNFVKDHCLQSVLCTGPLSAQLPDPGQEDWISTQWITLYGR